MKLFTGIIMGCYMVLFILLGMGLAAFSLHWVPVEGALWGLEAIYNDQNLRLACFLTGVGLVLLNGAIAQLALAKFQRQKTIAFENPDGQVTISLSAIEDYLRKSTREVPEVKELRSDVIAGKGKILVRARVALWSDSHIPEVTEKIQTLVKSRVQEMLAGIEEPVLVRVHVSKIVERQEAEAAGRREERLTTTPFRGY